MPHVWKRAWRYSIEEGGGEYTVTVFPDGDPVFHGVHGDPESISTGDCTLVWVCGSCNGMISSDSLEETPLPEDYVPDPSDVADEYLSSGLPCTYSHFPDEALSGLRDNPDRPRTCEEAQVRLVHES